MNPELTDNQAGEEPITDKPKRIITRKATAHLRRVTIYLTEDEKRQVGSWCALHGLKFAVLGRRAVLQYIKDFDNHFVLPDEVTEEERRAEAKIEY